VDKVLKVTKPAALRAAVTKFSRASNLTPAKQIRLTIPQSLLERSDNAYL
jgi:hypothetical protein